MPPTAFHFLTTPFLDVLLNILGLLSATAALLCIAFSLLHTVALLFISNTYPNLLTLFYFLAPFPLLIFAFLSYFVPIS